jgi:hypothetical protein
MSGQIHSLPGSGTFVPAAHTARSAAGAAALTFLALSIGSSLTRCPWMDEGVFADVALNFRNFGHLGSSVVDPYGYLEWPGVHQYTYWQFPLYVVSLGGWFRLVPTTVVWMRLFSVVWACLFLVSWFVIVRSLSRNESLALLVASVVGLDYVSVIAASDGRMDMMCASLGLAGLASYFWFRESNRARGVVVAAWFGAASLFCHPVGVVMNIAIGVMVLLDWRPIRWGTMVAALAPYLIGTAGCFYYIYQAPDVFLAQSRAASGYRVSGLGRILLNILNDVNKRYIYYYYAGYTGINKLKIGALVFPFGGVVGLLTDRNLRSQLVAKRLLLLACIAYVGIAVLDNQKYGNYLVFTVPVFTACGALWLYGRWQQGGLGRLLACCLLAVSVVTTFGAMGYKIYKNEYRNVYYPVVAAVRRSLPPGGLVMGGSELGFALGFGPPLVDDRYLGFFSGKRPDVFVIDQYYTPPEHSPRLVEAWKSSRATLRNQYHLVFENTVFSVYVRNDKSRISEPGK